MDIMGSDHGPVVPIRAAVMAAKELPADTRLVLIGNAEAIAEGLRAEGADHAAFDIVGSQDDITFSDNATKALQAKPKSSISIGFHLLKEGKAVWLMVARLILRVLGPAPAPMARRRETPRPG